MALPLPPDKYNPIPNSPFYTAESYTVQGAYYPLVVGAGLYVDASATTLISTGGGGGGVVGILPGAGISVSAPTGIVTVTNAGVTGISGGAGISVSSFSGNVTVSSTTLGTVTQINTSGDLTGGPITSTGTLGLSNTGVTAGSYTNPTISVDAKGRILTASSGTAVTAVTATSPITVTAGTTPDISILPATTATCGAVLLSDATNSTSSSTAATSLAVKNAYDLAALAIPKACITAKGTLISGSAASTPASVAVGADGQVLIADSSSASGLSWSTLTVGAATPTSLGSVYGCTSTLRVTLGADTGSTLNALGYVGVGYRTLCNPTMTGGAQTVAVGNCVLQNVTTATLNTAVGHAALQLNQSGNCNVVIGACAARVMTTGAQNVAVGYASLCTNVLGSYNTALGTLSAKNTTGFCNTALGYGSLCLLTSGSCNIGVGTFAGCALTNENSNVILGSHPGFTGVSGEIILANGTGTQGLRINNAGAIGTRSNDFGTSGYVLISQGVGAEWAWSPVNNVLDAPNYGSFYDTTSQTNTVSTGTPRAVKLNTTSISNNISVVSNTQITMAMAGLYNIQFSIQYETTVASLETIEIWFAKNGTAIPYSNTEFHAKGAGEAMLAALNFVDMAAAGDYYEIMWASSDSNMKLSAFASSYGGPSIPSAIVTVTPVGA